uniref:Uncharacterized protein n=1 Tax=viral metagenome TaxID=1070528 RepID=A0A6C0E0L9_9ZZZZ
MSKKLKEIDYLFEDPEISSQKYALVTIVGPHMPQKCDVWGMKVRGVSESIDKAKSLTQKLMKIDDSCDIYTVEVGKFFPLTVEPHSVENVEYQNAELNKLMKSYLENKQLANEQWSQRKAEMMQQAIKEGREKELLTNAPEHPIAVIQRIKTQQEKVEQLEEMLQTVREDLYTSKLKFWKYTNDEREKATTELLQQFTGDEENKVHEFLRSLKIDEQSSDYELHKVQDVSVNNTIQKLDKLEEELNELQELKNKIDVEISPNVYNRVTSNIQHIQIEISTLKDKLRDEKAVNDFINLNYKDSALNSLMDS